jgi:hypothetical protein
MEELRNPGPNLSRLTEEGRVRKRGAGRKAIEDQESFQEEGDRPLDWTCKSIRYLAAELSVRGRSVSYRTVGNLLHRMGYRFSPGESYKKHSIEDRRVQYRQMSRRIAASLEAGEPVFSVTFTKGEGVLGADDGLSQPASPDQGAARLAVAAVHSWWLHSGSTRYRGRKVLLVTDATAKCGGDQEIWASPLEELAKDLAVEVFMVHVPPGARRWRSLQAEGRLSFGCAAPGQPAGVLTVVLDLVLPGEGNRESGRSGTNRLQRSQELLG